MSLACVALSFAIAARAEDAPTVTPYRPSVSTPAALSATGWLEIEAGVQRSRADDPVRRDDLPYTVQLALSPDWGVRIGGDALVHQIGADGTAQRGGGDTAFVVKRRFALSDTSAFGLELGAKLPTAASGLGSGHTDVGFNGIFTSDFADNWHTDINLVATHLGGTEAGASPWQHGRAAALSRNLSERLGVVGEFSGTRQTANPRTAQALLATS